MKYNIESIILGFFLALIMVSCGADKEHFKLSGRLLNLNQGQFIVYSPDGAMAKADTLKVMGGRFDFKGECLKEGTVVVMLPNGSQVPLFVQPGASLEMNGDAQNLDMVEVTGTKANEVMNDFRKASAGKPDAAIPGIVKDIITKNPGEITGIYLIRNYLLPKADYGDAAKLVELMLEHQEDNSTLGAMRAQIKEMQSVEVGKPIPAFFAKTVEGTDFSASALKEGVAVVICWASWDSESVNLVNRILSIKGSDDSRPIVMGISFDADTYKTRNVVREENKDGTWYNTCDGKLVDGHLAHLFSVSQVPSVIIIKNGKIAERDLTGDRAIEKLNQMMHQ